MNDIIETIEYKDYEIQLCYDTLPDNPRTSWDNLGFMACFHKRYELGDEHNFLEPQELIDWIEASKDTIYYLPIYMYEHGNITISTKPFYDILPLSLNALLPFLPPEERPLSKVNSQ